MSNQDKQEILQAINGVNIRLDSMEKEMKDIKNDIRDLKTDVKDLKNNMRKVLKCVDHENADFNPTAVPKKRAHA